MINKHIRIQNYGKLKFLVILVLISVLFSGQAYAQSTNYALNFAGASDSKPNFGDINALDGAGQFSFETWLYIDNWVQGTNIFAKAAGSSSRIDLQLGSLVNNQVYVHVANGSNTFLEFHNILLTGTWQHVAVVYDGSLGTAVDRVKVYVNVDLKSHVGGPATTLVLPCHFIIKEVKAQSTFCGKDKCILFTSCFFDHLYEISSLLFLSAQHQAAISGIMEGHRYILTAA
ncbi:hypothetical protein QQ008_06850 [Fulvivirgaceae bacterium BMA10]|uniref:LamG domain-containing protein n=1 Tax=Splendidivirga corallicola TaxID=3051826 RepID=A0ABT8KK35_9BACT|nr:hypothetical protein [Fulvivirgaceae bacterium BMA10]